LSLILDFINNIRKKKVFTKMNLRWKYNNMRIKKENEWKAAFSIPKSVFEPTVMFFGLTNLKATFQTMMNDLLRDIIEAKNVATFIDDIIVGIKTEERYNNVVKEVLKRMVENDLFVKLKKCVENVRKVGFLEVVIEPDEVKIKK